MREEKHLDKLVIAANQKIKERDYWLKQLSGELVKTGFPYDRRIPFTPAQEETATGIKSVNRRLNHDVFKRLLQVSSNSDYTLHVLLTTGLVALLYKYTGHTDIIIGTPIYKQEMEGEFINTLLPLRVRFDETNTFKELLMQARQTVVEAIDHQSFPISLLGDRLHLPGQQNFLEMLDTMIMVRNIHQKEYIRDLSPGIVFNFFRAGEYIELTLEYNPSDYKSITVEAIANHYLQLLEQVLYHLDLMLIGIDFLSEEEKTRLLFDFNRTDADYPTDHSIHSLFEDQVRRTPDATAVTGNVPSLAFLTYNQLNETSAGLAHLLSAKGVKPDVIVGIKLERSLEMMIGILGILKAGGAYLPIDPEYPEDRINYMLEDSKAKVLLTAPGTQVKVKAEVEEGSGHPQELPLQIINIKKDIFNFSKNTSSTLISTSTLSEVGPANLAYVIYTSGSTGKPKGTMIRHYSLVNRLNWMQKEYRLDTSDTILQKTPFTFDVSVWELFWWGIVGAKLCFLVPGGEKDPGIIVNAIEKHNITVMHFVPSMLNVFLEFVKARNAGKRLKSLRQVIASGEALTLSQVELFNQLLLKQNNTRLANLYGPTEATIDVSWFDCSVEETLEIIPIGKPIDNTQFYIVDKRMHLQPLGIAGELCIAGDGLARGYLNRPELTAEKFIDLSNRSYMSYKTYIYKKIYKTGDLAQWLPDGNIEFLGRIDHQVKIRGFRIELGEIENQLAKHKDIKDVVVISKDSDIGDKYLSAYLVASQEVPLMELREFLLQTLPDFMVPAYFTFLEQMPLTANGKVNRKALPEPEKKAGGKYVAPRDKLEEKLAEIWSQELGIEKEKISIDSSFFELGGHSLRATRVIAKIHKELSVNVTMAEMFDAPVIRKLAERIKLMTTEEYAAIEPIEKKEFYALSPAQKRLYILHQMDRQGIGYNIPTCSRLDGEMHKDRFENAFKQLINRHESLRTSFQVVDEEPVQRIHDQVECEIEYYDSGKQGNRETGRQGNRETGSELTKAFVRPFDLSRAPLMRVGLIKTHKQEHILILDMHHIISDGTSEQILFQDFSNLYSGKELAGIKLQYKDYAQWQNRQKSNENLVKQKEYWINMFKGELPVLVLPADYPRPAVQSFAGRNKSFEISEETTAALKELTLETGTTLYMVLLSIFNVFLAKLSNQEDIVVGTPLAGRRHADLEKIIGIFINTLALRNFPLKEKKFSNFLQEVKENTLKAFENQDYQYEDLVEQVAVNRDVSRNPLFDAMLILQNFDARELETPGLTLSPHKYENRTAKFDLTMYGMEIGDKLLFTFEYCTKIFTGETIERFIGVFKKVISGVLNDRKQDIKIWEIDIISVEEKKRILFDFNDTETGYPKEKTLHGLFEEQVERTPHHVALVGIHETHERHQKKDNMSHMSHMSYKELNEKAQQLAHLLQEKGVRPGTIVSLMMERSIEMVIGLLAILKAGGAYLPIEPGYPEERINYMLKDSGARVLLASPDIQVKVLSSPSTLTSTSALSEVGPADLAYVIYTSGSTGKPKGVMIQHQSVINFIQGMSAGIPFLPGKTILAVTTITFDISVLEIFLPLAKGLKILLASERQQIEPDALEEIMVKHSVQMAQFTPSRLKLLLSGRENLEGFQHTGELLVGGEAFPMDLFKEIKNRFKGKIFNMYGPTETTIWSSFKDLTQLDSINIGTPIANTQVYILNDSLGIQPVGVVGELYIGGDGLARGYLNRPMLTAGKFLATDEHGRTRTGFNQKFLQGGPGGAVFSKSAPPGRRRLYRTGDLARWLNDGDIEFIGRVDYQVKIRGFRIELGEIESQLLKCQDIDEAVVIDRKNKEGKEFLCAYLVSKKKMGIAELKGTLARILPDYMIPSYFIQVEKIPLTFNGKIDRKTLESYDIDLNIRKEYVAPRNEIERKIAQTWKEVLKLEKVGVNENFFDLGGTSMDVIRLNVKFKEAFNETDTVMQMFRYPTIISFAEYLSRKREGIDTNNDIQRSLSVGKIKKTRQTQRDKRMRGGISNG